MASVNINLDGMRQLQRQIERLAKAFPEGKTEEISLQAAEVIAEDARQRAPVESGRLKRAIQAKRWKRGKSESVVLAAVDRSKNGAPHAGLVEFGTSRTAAKPYFRPAVESKSGESRRILEQGLRQLVEEAVK